MEKDKWPKRSGQSIIPAKSLYKKYKFNRTRRFSNVSMFRIDKSGAYEESAHQRAI